MLSASSSSPSPNLFTSPVAARRRSSFRITASHTATARPATAAPSLYVVLGLKASANFNEIKAAYRTLALTCHPDVCEGSSDEFMRVHAAYSTLSDPNKRAIYDRGLGVVVEGPQRRATARTTSYSRTQSFPGFGQRTWETDQCW